MYIYIYILTYKQTYIRIHVYISIYISYIYTYIYIHMSCITQYFFNFDDEFRKKRKKKAGTVSQGNSIY